jgi:hypothetical protein
MKKYYWKKHGSDAYHWHKTCSLVPANVETDPDWATGYTPPAGREKCNQCKSKD